MSERSRNNQAIKSRRESPQGLAAAFKWGFNPNGKGPTINRTLLIVNPIIMVPMVVLMGGLRENFLTSYFCSLLIGNTVSVTCFVFKGMIAGIGHRILKRPLKRRTYILASLAGMFPGLWLGFDIVGRVARALGHDRDAPSLSDYGTGIMVGSLIFFVIILIDLWSEARSVAARFENETLQAKLSALSAQMNPHFLFNALNTIASTISSNPDAAEETTLKLSDLYRGILKSSQRSVHSLLEEFELCRAYLGIESARFSDRIRWSIDAEPGLETFEIPSLLIQPLVENAIKHGLSQRAQGGSVCVTATRSGEFVEIVVEDDGVGFGNSGAKGGTGTGVSSCRSRLELAYSGAASFEMGAGDDGRGTRIRIRIPRRRGAVT